MFERLERLQQLERLERLQQLEGLERLQQLERLERLQQLETTVMDYREYEYQEGDVVYCDIPYQNGDGKNDDYNNKTKFNHGEFYEWAISKTYPVYFSSYSLGKLVWSKPKNQTLCASANNIKRIESLYCVTNEVL